MTTLSTAVFIYTLAVAVVSEIPPKYILKVTPYCGKGAVEDARIEILTDLHIAAQVECAGSKTVDFTTTDHVNFKAPVSYPGKGAASQPCVFKKRMNAMVFDVTVKVAYGEMPGVVKPNSVLSNNQIPDVDPANMPGLVHMKEEIWTVTCSFGKYGTGTVWDGGKKVVEGCIAPSELLTNMGSDIQTPNSTLFTLEMVDVAGGSLTNQDVHMGRTVQLKGKSTDHRIRPVSCFVMDDTAAYAILRGGCGDGIIFEKDQGFITKGKTTLSPYFGAFKLNFAPTIVFKCTFLVCEKTCDGFHAAPSIQGTNAGAANRAMARFSKHLPNTLYSLVRRR